MDGPARPSGRLDPDVVTPCPVCGLAERERAFRAKIRGKYDVQYFLCSACGTLQTEPPYWLQETYGTDLGDYDTDQAARALYCARRVGALLYFLFDRSGKYLDHAGGYGLYTRLMRDIGFDYRWWDPYTRNLFANGFEAGPEERFDVVSAFEVLEHVSDPVAFIANLREVRRCQAFIFSTQLFAGSPPLPTSGPITPLTAASMFPSIKREASRAWRSVSVANS